MALSICNCYLEVFKSGITSKLYKQELWFLYSACRLMMLNICMQFQDDIFNGFHVNHRHDFVTDMLITNFKGMSLKKYMFKSYGSCTLHAIFGS